MKNAITLHNADEVRIAVKQEAEDLKRNLIAQAACIKEVDDDFTAQCGAEIIVGIKRLIKEMEAARKDVKAPILEIGRKIDDIAKAFCESLVDEQCRINYMLIKYNDKIEKARQLAIAEAERKAKEAQAKIDAERKAEPARESIFESVMHRTEALQEARTIAKEKTLEGSGVSFRTVVDFEVEDVLELVKHHLDMVTITPKRSVIIQSLKAGHNIHGVKRIERKDTTIYGGGK